MSYDGRHKTLIRYEQLVTEAHHVLHLIPRNTSRQRRIAAALTVEPEPSQLTVNEDYFGNVMHHLTIHAPHQELLIESRSRVEILSPAQAINPGASPSCAPRTATRTNRGVTCALSPCGTLR